MLMKTLVAHVSGKASVTRVNKEWILSRCSGEVSQEAWGQDPAQAREGAVA
jgi:hypothetical protein